VEPAFHVKRTSALLQYRKSGVPVSPELGIARSRFARGGDGLFGNRCANGPRIVQGQCDQCVRLWERYYAAALDEYAWQERLSGAEKANVSGELAKLRSAVRTAQATADGLRREIAAHRVLHRSQVQADEI